MNYEAIIDGIIGREKGYVNHPDDRGGETNWGITIAVARAHGYMGPMRDMPRTEAERIYVETYIREPNFHRVAELSEPIAEELIDTGVNMGVGIPSMFLQDALNVLNMQGSMYPDVTVDGNIGPATLNALAAFLNERGDEGEVVLLRVLNGLQLARYVDMTKRRERNETFFYGWVLNRVIV